MLAARELSNKMINRTKGGILAIGMVVLNLTISWFNEYHFLFIGMAVIWIIAAIYAFKDRIIRFFRR